jgi:hypothetical protein
METNYFGAATKAAVAKFQVLNATDTLAPIGATKGTGNVFSLTRAALNQICSGTVSTNPTTPTQSGAVSVSLSPNQPYTVLVAGQATARLADFTFNGNGTVSNVTFLRTGVSSNDTLSNVYLFDGNMRIAGPASVATNGSTITFGSVSGLFTVSGSKVLTVRSDIKTGVSGQSVGVTLTGYTVIGSTMAATSVAGPQLPVANVTLLGADFPTGNSTLPSNTAINAGTMNQTVWSRSLNISTRSAKLYGMTLRMIGSAPTNSLANANLYVDGVSVDTADVDAQGYMNFVIGNPTVLTTGSHVIEVRADVVGGANRNFYVSMEQASDIRIEDSQVSGAFVTVTTNSGSTAVNLIGGTVTINNGTLTITQDTSFNNTTTIVGGASNVKMAAFKFTSYGEDVKVTSLTFTPTITGTATTLSNVGLYINGGQVNSNQTATTATPLVFNNLGTNLLVPSGKTVLVEIRGDAISSTNVAFTTGSVKFDLAAGTNNAQGITSSQLTNTSTAGGQSLTISNSNVTFASTAGFSASTKAPNQSNVKIGSFTLQTGSAEGVVATNIAVGLSGTMLTNNQITNLKVMNGSTQIGNSIGNPTTSNNFSANVTVGQGSTSVFDVYADIGSSAATYAITPTMLITYRGSSSNLSASTNSGTPTTGVVTTANAAIIVASGVTINTGLSPVSQLVVGGNSAFGIATFNFKVNNAVAGGMIKDVTFTVPANTISSITMNGKTASVVGTTATIYNVGATVPADGSGVNLAVTVALVCAGTANGCPANSPVTTSIQIPTVTYYDGATTQTLTAIGTATSSNYFIVGSKPSLAVNSTQQTGLVLGAENKIGEVTVSADAAGKVTLTQIQFATSTTGITSPVISSPRITDGSTNVSGASCAVSGVNINCTMGGFEIGAGTSKTFGLYATVSGTAVASTVVSVGTALTTGGFTWNDVIGGGTGITGANIYNFPTASYSIRQ